VIDNRRKSELPDRQHDAARQQTI